MSANNKLRVAFYDPSGHGGICHYTYQLAESLAQSGAEVTVVTTEGYELQHLERNFELKFLFRKSRLKNLAENILGRAPAKTLSETKQPSVRSGRAPDERIPTPQFVKNARIRWLLCKQALAFLFDRPSVIHMQWLIDRREDYKFVKLLKLLGFTVVYTAHDLLPNTNEARDDHKLLQRIYSRVDAVIVHANESKNELAGIFDIPASKIHVISHGSNDLFYHDNNLSKESARKALGICRGQRVILFFGIIKRYKGLEYLLDAFEEVKKQVPHVVLLVVGTIYDRDPEGLSYYSSLLEQVCRRDDIICVRSYVPFEKIGEYFTASDIVTLPYTKTYTSGVLLAAYAAGRPVVATDTGAMSEIVESGKSGFIVPPKDAKALSKAIVQIFNRPDIEEMGRYAKHLAETRYSWSHIASQTSGLYRSLIA